MSVEVVVALIGGAAVVLGAGIGAWFKWRATRISALERRVDRLERRNRTLWLYCRRLIDHIYRGMGPPPPRWPDELEDDEGG